MIVRFDLNRFDFDSTIMNDSVQLTTLVGVVNGLWLVLQHDNLDHVADLFIGIADGSNNPLSLCVASFHAAHFA